MDKSAHSGLLRFDQADLPLAMPFLQLLFAHDRGFRIVEDFKVHQLVDAVTRGETAHGLQLMLMNAAHEIVGHANVQGSVLAAGQDVDEELPVHSTRSGYGFRASPLARLARNDAELHGLQIRLERLDRDFYRR